MQHLFVIAAVGSYVGPGMMIDGLPVSISFKLSCSCSEHLHQILEIVRVLLVDLGKLMGEIGHYKGVGKMKKRIIRSAFHKNAFQHNRDEWRPPLECQPGGCLCPRLFFFTHPESFHQRCNDREQESIKEHNHLHNGGAPSTVAGILVFPLLTDPSHS